MSKPFYYLMSSVSCVVLSQSVMAQNASPPSPAQAGATAASGGQHDDGIAEIIVTAQKESQSLQKTPLAVTAIGKDLIAERGISDLLDAENSLPSTRIQSNNATVQIYVRGIGSSNDFANTEPPVAFNLNGIYIPREGISMGFYDLERIELVPGPQGTLYGRSALGGAVNVLFQRPTRELETKISGEIGNYNLYHGTLVQNIPISDGLAFRAGVDYTNRDGYLKSNSGAVNDFGARLGVQYSPSDNLTAYVWSFINRKRGTSTNLVNKGFNPQTFTVDGKSFLHDDAWDDTMTGPLTVFTGLFGPIQALPQHYNSEAVGAQIDWTIGDVTVTEIPGYIHVDSASEYYLSALRGIYDAQIKSYSNELRLSGDNGGLKWLTGLNLYRQVNSDASSVLPIFGNSVANVSEGLGLYAHLTYSVTDAFRVTLGGRYSADSRKGDGVVTFVPFQPGTVPWTAKVSSNRPDWKGGLEYDATDQVMLYATAQSGYQPATYNATLKTPQFDNAIRAATITAFTGGFKSRFLDNKLQVNSESFYYIYRGLPLQAFNLAQTFFPIFSTQLVKIYGNQTDIVFRPTSSDELTASIGYLHARQTKAIAPVDPTFGLSSGVNYSGLQPQNAPTSTITGGYSHDFNLGGGYIRLGVDTRYESSFFGVYSHVAGSRQKAYTMSDASLTYNAGERWTLGAWVKNIENEPVQSASGAGGIPGPAIVYLQAPRTFGVRGTYNF